ncbi:MAG: hypothetical protein ACPG80_06265, partial [Rickettsiales bacterium]
GVARDYIEFMEANVGTDACDGTGGMGSGGGGGGAEINECKGTVGEIGDTFGMANCDGEDEEDEDEKSGMEMVENAAEDIKPELYYCNTGERLDLNGGCTDCSGMVYKAYKRTTGKEMGANCSHEIYVWSLANGGEEITFDEALRTPGAGLTKAEYCGVGNGSHIGLSAGDGRHTIETGGMYLDTDDTPKPAGWNGTVGYGILTDEWDHYFTIPGISGTMSGGDAGLCHYALIANPTGKEDIEPPEYFEKYDEAWPMSKQEKVQVLDSRARGNNMAGKDRKACNEIWDRKQLQLLKILDPEAAKEAAEGGEEGEEEDDDMPDGPLTESGGFIHPTQCGALPT